MRRRPPTSTRTATPFPYTTLFRSLRSSYPFAWTSHYLASRYERVDPVIRQAASTPQPFEWGLGCGPERLSRQQKQLLDEAAAFGIRCGDRKSTRLNSSH